MQRRTRERAQGEPVRKATVLALVIAGVLAVAYGAWYRPALAPVNPADSRPQLVHVQRGMSARGVVNLLRRTGLVRSRMATLLYAAATRQATKLRPGYYDLAPSMSTPEIVETIASGRIAQRKVVVVPGLTLRQIADRVDRSGLASRRDFLAVAAVARNFSGEVSFPLPEGKSVEGYLFPATYQFPVGTTPAQIISRMLQAFEVNFYRPNCHEIERSPLGLHGLVTLASMVEREAAVDEERPVIAGVLVNRLRMGWKLQCDATVQYALGRHKPRLLYKDLKVPSPYNTYLHNGLPPGPICSPGLKSLLAALRPAQHSYLFYVARGNGRHKFTSTYAQHLSAIQELRKKGLRP